MLSNLLCNYHISLRFSHQFAILTFWSRVPTWTFAIFISDCNFHIILQFSCHESNTYLYSFEWFLCHYDLDLLNSTSAKVHCGRQIIHKCYGTMQLNKKLFPTCFSYLLVASCWHTCQISYIGTLGEYVGIEILSPNTSLPPAPPIVSRDTRGGSLGDNTSRQGWCINSRISLVATILFYLVLAYSSSYDKVVLTRATHKTHTHARYDLS
jgi:hypothetical protein